MARITRRDFLRCGAAAGVGAGLLPRLSFAADAPAAEAVPLRQPNFLFINTDQQRFDTFRYNGCAQALTPHVERLAAEGVRFDKAFTSHPVCMPARASWFTGQYPATHGVWHNGVPLRQDADMLQTHLKAAGYHTALIGKIHLDNINNRNVKHPAYGFDPLIEANGDPFYKDDYFQWLDKQGPGLFAGYHEQIRRHGHVAAFTRNLDEDLHMNNWMTGHVERYLDERALDRKPFFLSVGFFDPHHPFDPVEPYASMFDPDDMPLPRYKEGELEAMTPHARKRIREETRNPAHIRQVIASYHAMCTHVDAMVGRIMARLKQAGLEEDTVVIYSSDHGEMLGDHGLILKGPLFYEGALRIPLIWRFPRRAGVRAAVDTGFASHVDFAPTVAALAGIKGPAFMQGRPLFDRSLRLRPVPASDAALTEWREPGEASCAFARCLVTDDWKYVQYEGETCGELYDRRRDPDEYANLWAVPAHKPDVAMMRDRLATFTRRARIDDTAPLAKRTNEF